MSDSPTGRSRWRNRAESPKSLPIKVTRTLKGDFEVYLPSRQRSVVVDNRNKARVLVNTERVITPGATVDWPRTGV